MHEQAAWTSTPWCCHHHLFLYFLIVLGSMSTWRRLFSLLSAEQASLPVAVYFISETTSCMLHRTMNGLIGDVQGYTPLMHWNQCFCSTWFKCQQQRLNDIRAALLRNDYLKKQIFNLHMNKISLFEQLLHGKIMSRGIIKGTNNDADRSGKKQLYFTIS